MKGDSPFEVDATPGQIRALIEGGHIEVVEPLQTEARKPPKPRPAWEKPQTDSAPRPKEGIRNA